MHGNYFWTSLRTHLKVMVKKKRHDNILVAHQMVFSKENFKHMENDSANKEKWNGTRLCRLDG